MDAVYGRVQFRRRLLKPENFRLSQFRLPLAARGACTITVEKCCDWLQQLRHEYSC